MDARAVFHPGHEVFCLKTYRTCCGVEKRRLDARTESIFDVKGFHFGQIRIRDFRVGVLERDQFVIFYSKR